MNTNKTYPSKVDWWLGVLLMFVLLCGVGSVGAGIWGLIVKGDPMWWFLLPGLCIVLFMTCVVWPIEYVLSDDELIVRIGLFRSPYKYSTITGIKPSRNPLSSPALSLDRLEIKYKGKIGFFMVSPKDKEGFMEELASRTSHLKFENGEVREKDLSSSHT